MSRQSIAVRNARANEMQQLAALLAAAFYDDPVWGPYFMPDERRRLAGLTRFLRTILHRGADRRDGCRGASALAGGCRCAEGGTPDPCPRDHLARPGVKLERTQAARWPSDRPSSPALAAEDEPA